MDIITIIDIIAKDDDGDDEAYGKHSVAFRRTKRYVNKCNLCIVIGCLFLIKRFLVVKLQPGDYEPESLTDIFRRLLCNFQDCVAKANDCGAVPVPYQVRCCLLAFSFLNQNA